MDQRMALEWIHSNIEKFGGDPNRVTLSGQSAGASCILIHLVSPKTKPNLFQKVVMMGCPFSLLFRRRKQNEEFTRMFALNLGCSLNDRECFEKKKTEEIVKASFNTILIPTPPLLNTRNILPWAPTIDGEEIPNQPMRLLRQGKFNKNVEVVIGFNREEAAIFILRAVSFEIQRWQLTALAFAWLGFLAPEVLRMYPQRHHDGRHTVIELGNDYYFYCAGLAATKEFTKHNVSSSVYLFDYAPFRDIPNSFPACSSHNYSCHSAELTFFWKSYGFYNEGALRNENEKKLSTEMLNTLANFAHGKPSSLVKYEIEKDEIFSFSMKSKVLKGYRSDMCKMWDRIGNFFVE
jgi:carboxylesterase type B